MNFKVYKWCAVPQWINTSLNTEQTIRLMGPVSQVRMKPECLAKKFECQLDIKKAHLALYNGHI